jgi:hypothetical protein
MRALRRPLQAAEEAVLERGASAAVEKTCGVSAACNLTSCRVLIFQHPANSILRPDLGRPPMIRSKALPAAAASFLLFLFVLELATSGLGLGQVTPGFAGSPSGASPAVAPYGPNPRYLTDQNGNPRFLIGVYRFFSAERAEWMAMLDRLEKAELNAVRTLAIADGWIAPGEVPDQKPRPFRRTGAGKILADGGPRFHLAELDERFWRSYADFLAEAEQRNVTVVSELFGVSGPFGGPEDAKCAADPRRCFQHNVWHRTNSAGGPVHRGNDWRTMSEARRDFFNVNGSLHDVQKRVLDRYLTITVRRRNVVYQPVNEFFGEPMGDCLNSRAGKAWVNWVRDAIRSRRPDAVVLLNVRGIDRFPANGLHEPGYQGITIHAPHDGNVGEPAFSLERMAAEAPRHHASGRFVGYDEDVGRPYTCDDYQDYQRQAAWIALTTGAGSYILLEDLFLSEPWCNRCDNPCPRPDPGRDFRYLTRFLAARAVKPWDMAPAPEIGGSAVTALAAPDGTILAYLRPSGAAPALDLSRAPAALAGEWYDPRTGRFSPVRDPILGAAVPMSPPGSGDWVLLLKPLASAGP